MWEDGTGTVHRIEQGEGGERAVNRGLRPTLANPIVANPFFECVVVVGFGGKVFYVVCFCLFVVCVWWVCSGPLRRTPLRPTAQNFALFFSPATVFILFSLSCWSFSLNFGGVFEDRDPQMCI